MVAMKAGDHSIDVRNVLGAERVKSSVKDLLSATDEFFSLHWLQSSILGNAPQWKIWENFLCGSVPNFDLGGCYALFSGDELIYVGLGASRGGGIYPNHGISRRLMAHVICADRERGREWAKLREPWMDVTSLYSIGFPHDQAYLPAALEGFLIRKLSPPRNSRV